MGDADGARFAPFMGEDSPDSNESMTDIIMRDQIRRSEAVLGRSLSNRERDTMISYYQDMRRGRGAPSEANKPTTTIHSPTNQKEAKDEPGSFDLEEDLRKEIERLEAQLRDVAQGGLTLLRLERDAVEGRLASLEAELDAVKAELSDLKACFEACTDAENGNLKDGKRAWDSPQPAHNQRGGLFGIKSVMFAMAVLVWLVTEAMLHSKRLADGYGGYVNGGYNGLGSVLIFGTWVKFMVFEVAVVFLGVLASGAVMG
ncbi:hypothetical protein N657DRAFT_567104 [Parathielavia appendiculata]|uniref:Uncharacterized protein n=1 Tax=Parathielavia appendiculata TaxID=2587402 RepID=A0AAN6U577_9PEZI|nr:hypothetical protein N657DRAFT_567104 [Parathielavia appendiculata]